MAPYQVSLINALNSTSKTEEEARRRTFNLLTLLMLFFHLLDILTAFANLYYSCSFLVDDSKVLQVTSISKCMKDDLSMGLDTLNESSSDKLGGHDNVSDLLVMSLVRLLVNPLVIGVALKFGGFRSDDMKEEEDSLSTPLLNVNDRESSITDTISSSSSPLSSPPTTESTSYAKRKQIALLASSDSNKQKLRAKFIRGVCLTLFFISSTVFQLYNGLKVSTFDFQGEVEEEEKEIVVVTSSSSGEKLSFQPPLMCISILYINVLVYLGRTLILEFTRDEGLFLPEVHRHPIFWKTEVALHW